jgi:bifunctional non-homologous end joining protein LigD
MSLATYHRKRKFAETPEPRGRAAAARGPLRFVVQKHHATRLHYDFRLEVGGTLKSWAVPKGPSLNPDDKRLAVMVEDHPLDYRTFEGTIPAGNYGAGHVIVWDAGTYEVPGADDRQGAERAARDGLAAGRLTVVLHGQKLRGEFALVKTGRGDPNGWLLIKKHDEFATSTDVTADEQSVQSGRTLDDVAAGVRGHVRRQSPTRGSRSRPRTSTAVPPRNIRPMLATLVEAPFDRPGWLFEVKWDGYRAIAEVSRDQVRLYSRAGQPFEEKFAPVVRALRDLRHEAVLDGEVVAVDRDGRSQFQLLQNYQKTGRGDLVYYAFDLLSFDGRDLRSEPLTKRKAILHRLLGRGRGVVRISDHVEGDGVAFFRAAVAAGLEGIIAKDGESPYREGVRSPAWVKVKSRHRQEAVIGGFTAPRGRRTGLGALVLGVYEGPDLVYIGHTGGGLDTAGLADLRARLDPLVRTTCPFRVKPRTNAPVTWVEPELVCEVVFQEWTHDGRMRQPIFVGMREDKPAAAVVREHPLPIAGRDEKTRLPRAAPTAITSAGARSARPPTGGPPLTNLDKVYWPAEGITKGDLIDYYREVATVIVPHLSDRPLSLHRHPDGITGESFFQKDVSKRPPPSWVQTTRVGTGEKGIRYALCQDEASLLSLANLGCIEFNPWLSRVGSLDRPDFLVIDLDPQGLPFPRVVEAAIAVRKLLEKVGAESLCKTSGKRGLHVCVPLGARYDYDVARQFAEVLASIVHRQLPRSTSVVRSPALRQRRVYLDYLQNRTGQTLAAPYSVRPVPGATVSTPLRWSEVRSGLNPARFTMKTIPPRLAKGGDLWGPIAGPGPDLGDCLERLNRAGK